MTSRLYLAGGGDEHQSFTVDKQFTKNINNILYIPIAWDNNNEYNTCVDWFTNCMAQHNINDITTLTDLTKEITLNQFDAVYIGGGNTFKLLKLIKESQFDKKLLDYYNNGGTIYGGSAGAIILGSTITCAAYCKDKDENKVNLQDITALNLVYNCDIQCHYEDDQLDLHVQLSARTGRCIYAIPEESALLIENNTLKVIGEKPVTHISVGRVRKIPPDSN